MRKMKWFCAIVLIATMVVSGMPMKMIRNVTNVKAGTGGASICGMEVSTTVEENGYYYGREGRYKYEVLKDGTIKIVHFDLFIPADDPIADWAMIPSEINEKAVTCIGCGAFKEYWDLVEIVIPDSVTTIENDAFNDCKNLKKIVMSDSIMSIGDRAFYNCKKLESIIISLNTTIGEDAFVGCDNLEIEYKELTTEDNTTAMTEAPTTEVLDVEVPTIEVDTTTYETTTPTETTQIEPTTEGSTMEETTKVAESTTEAPKATELSTTTVIPTTTKESETTAGNVSVGKTKVKKVTKKLLSKKAKISLKCISGAQYQVKVSATKKFKAKDTITKKVTKATLTINNKKIKNKKVLYVKARAYRVVDGKTYYGNWSKVKRVKVKK